MLSRFHLIPERYGRTDRQTDGQTDRLAISISRVSVLTRDKNRLFKTAPDIDKPPFQFIHTMDMSLVDMTLYDSPDLVIHRN